MKKHKGLFICLGVLIVLGIIAFIGIKKLVYPDSSKNKYGDRLAGIEEHVISDEVVNEMKESFLAKENVVDFEFVLTGKIIKIFVKVKEDTEVDKSKELSEIITKNISEEDQKFYDILYYVTCEGENELYPILGSKHKTSDLFMWTEKLEELSEEGESDAE